MENETHKRIERLENDVRALRIEVDEIKGNKSLKKAAIQTDQIIQENQTDKTIQASQPDQSNDKIEANHIAQSDETFPVNQTDNPPQTLNLDEAIRNEQATQPTAATQSQPPTHSNKITQSKQTTQLIPTLNKPPQEVENHLVKLNKAALAKNKKPVTIEPEHNKADTSIPAQLPQKQRSFEEIILWLLPKIFMLILVLGVLWGLKVISDFGLLSNAVKIGLAYALSIAFFIIAIIMDLKKPESSQIFTIVLYGGAFIIGILTTAAGAILYNILGLYLALLLALVYIAYGITICSVKKNEVLSIFVIFTSLLLPYLLEYMEFDGMIIVLYVLVVYGCMQFIFMKHIQSIAMYISYFFSILAVQVIWSLNDERTGIYVLSCILLNLMFILVWWRLYKPYSQWRTLHEGLFFSLSCLTVFMINLFTDAAALPLLLLAVFYGSMAQYANRRSQTRVVDIAGTLSILTIFNLIIVINAIDDLEIVLLPLCTFLGLLLGLKLNANVMKIMYSILFAFFVFVHLIVDEIEPFWTIEHLNYLLILIYLIGLMVYLKQLTKIEFNKENKAKVNFSLDIFPIFLAIYFFIYVLKLDLAYLSSHGYVTAIVLAIIMLAFLFVSEKMIGRGLRYVLIFAFLLTYLNLLPIHYVYDSDIWMNLLVRIVYAIIIFAILADIYIKGYLYRTWISHWKIDADSILTIGILGSMFLLYSLLSQFLFDGLLNYFLVVTGKTLLLFVTASISLWMNANRQLRKVKVTGYCLLLIAIMKLIFFDLDSLNLVIRALLFMIIGGIGLFLSNRLLQNKTKNE